MRARIFWHFRILKIRSDDVIILRSVKNGHFGQIVEEKHNNDSCDDDNNEKIENQNQRKAEVAETAPSCNYCVATIVAKQLLTTVRGGNQHSGLQRNQA